MKQSRVTKKIRQAGNANRSAALSGADKAGPVRPSKERELKCIIVLFVNTSWLNTKSVGCVPIVSARIKPVMLSWALLFLRAAQLPLEPQRIPALLVKGLVRDGIRGKYAVELVTVTGRYKTPPHLNSACSADLPAKGERT